jgi:hypothetical protein
MKTALFCLARTWFKTDFVLKVRHSIVHSFLLETDVLEYLLLEMFVMALSRESLQE